MYRFLATPKWIAGLVLGVVTVVLFTTLGFWQLSRHDERQAFNTTLTERGAAPAVGAEALAGGDADALAYRRARLAGTYEPEGEVLLAAQTHEGRAGHHVLTPLRTADDQLVVVDRGWVPLEETEPPVAAAAPPSGPVEVEGLLLPSEPARRAGAFEGGGGLEFVSARDLDRLADWLDEPVAPVVLLAEDQSPANPGGLPAGAAPPEVEEGNHLSYAIQWFLFAGVVTVGFPVLVRRTARDRGRPHGGGVARTEEPVGA